MKSRTIHIDLFSGAGGFHEGLIRAGFKFTHHYFSEIDKHAIANYRYNYKDAEYIGSVTNVRHIIRTVDRKPEDRVILTFGSPCQDFSLAGKREGLEGSKSSLIKFALVLIKWIRPDVYIWENVKGAYSSNGGADYWAIIQAFANIDGYRFEQQLLNTSWVLPQNRERIYLVGHLRDRSKPGVFPIGENDFRAYERTVETSIVGTLSAGGNSGGLHSQMTLIKTNTSKGFEIANEGDSINFSNPNSKTRRGRVGKGVAQTLDTQANQGVIQVNPNTESGGKQPYQQNRIYSDEGVTPALNAGKSDLIVKCGAFRGRGEDNNQNLELRNDENTNSLTSVEKDNVIVKIAHVSRTDEAKEIRKKSMQNGKDYTPFQGKKLDFIENDTMNTVTCATQKDNLISVQSNIRRLTEIECERLQGFRDNHTKFGIYEKQVWINKKERTFKIVEHLHPIPKTQRYKLMGNAVTCDIVQLIGERIELI